MVNLNGSHNLYNIHEINNLLQISRKYEANNMIKPSIIFISNHIALFLGIYFIYLASDKHQNQIYVILACAFTTLILIRNFMIFHDLHHASFFPSNERKYNKYGINRQIGDNLDILYIWSGPAWRETHSQHHKTHGNLLEYDPARTVITTTEYNKLSSTKQIIYSILHYPLVFFLFTVPLWNSVLSNIIHWRVTFIVKNIIAFMGIYYFTNKSTVFYLLLCIYVAHIMGVVLFHLQHSVNDPSYWRRYRSDDYVSKMNAELIDSSVIKIPEILKPFTNGIEYHNVHHLNPGVPSYNIRKCYEEMRNKKLLKNREIGYAEMFKSLSHQFYDDQNNVYL